MCCVWLKTGSSSRWNLFPLIYIKWGMVFKFVYWGLRMELIMFDRAVAICLLPAWLLSLEMRTSSPSGQRQRRYFTMGFLAWSMLGVCLRCVCTIGRPWILFQCLFLPSAVGASTSLGTLRPSSDRVSGLVFLLLLLFFLCHRSELATTKLDVFLLFFFGKANGAEFFVSPE